MRICRGRRVSIASITTAARDADHERVSGGLTIKLRLFCDRYTMAE